MADTSIDTEEIIQRVLRKMEARTDGKGHWTDCLRTAIEEYMDDAVKDLVKELNGEKLPDVIDEDE